MKVNMVRLEAAKLIRRATFASCLLGLLLMSLPNVRPNRHRDDPGSHV